MQRGINYGISLMHFNKWLHCELMNLRTRLDEAFGRISETKNLGRGNLD